MQQTLTTFQGTYRFIRYSEYKAQNIFVKILNRY